MLVQLRRFGAAFVPGWIVKPRRLTRGLIPGPGRARIGHQSLFLEHLEGKVKEIEGNSFSAFTAAFPKSIRNLAGRAKNTLI